MKQDYSFPDIQQLRVLYTLYKVQSVHKTADLLHITPPAVSYCLRKLRNNFQDPLFVRSQHDFLPTEKTHQIMRKLPHILNQFDNLLEESTPFIPAEYNGVISLAVPQVFSWLICPLVIKLNQEAPNLKINIISSTDYTFNELVNGQLDFAVNITNNHPKSLTQRNVIKLNYGVLLNKNHPLLSYQHFNINQLIKYPFIRMETLESCYIINQLENNSHKLIHKNLENSGISIADFYSAIDFISANDYVMLGSKESLRIANFKEKIIYKELLEVSNSHLESYLKLYFHSKQRQTPLFQWFVVFFKKFLLEWNSSE